MVGILFNLGGRCICDLIVHYLFGRPANTIRCQQYLGNKERDYCPDSQVFCQVLLTPLSEQSKKFLNLYLIVSRMGTIGKGSTIQLISHNLHDGKVYQR